jgi:cytochrome c-type biogenesis protein CcmH/NrfG
MPTSDTIVCPRCGERLPGGFGRCDACGAFLVALPAPGEAGHAPRGAGSRPVKGRAAQPPSQPVAGIAWALLVVGLVLGGAIGYALHGAVGPRGEGGMPTGPADMMAAGPADGAPGGAGAGAPPQMPAEVTLQVQKFRQVLARDPDDLEANVGFGNLLFDSGQWQRAVEHYARALAQDPKNADVRVDMAIAYHNLGRDDQARAEMERVTREAPHHRNAWLNLGVVTAAMGDNAAAVQAWERYLALEPNGSHSASIREELARLKQGS